jgi:hypothetical protein
MVDPDRVGDLRRDSLQPGGFPGAACRWLAVCRAVRQVAGRLIDGRIEIVGAGQVEDLSTSGEHEGVAGVVGVNLKTGSALERGRLIHVGRGEDRCADQPLARSEGQPADATKADPGLGVADQACQLRVRRGSPQHEQVEAVDSVVVTTVLAQRLSCAENRTKADELSKVRASGVAEAGSVAAQFETGVDRASDMVISGASECSGEVHVEPGFDLVAAPEAIAAAGIGDWWWESARPAFAGDEEADTLSGSSGAGCDVGHGNQPGIREAQDADTLDGLEVGDGRQHGILEGCSVAVELRELDAVGPADQGVSAAGLEDGIDELTGLEVGAADDQREGMDGHD